MIIIRNQGIDRCMFCYHILYNMKTKGLDWPVAKLHFINASSYALIVIIWMQIGNTNCDQRAYIQWNAIGVKPCNFQITVW
jgi:hypothetical protein